jgi:signal transduction histidine kinase
MSRRARFCLVAVSGFVFVQATASLLLRSGFALTAASDLIQSALLLAGTLVFLTNALATRGRTRLFWLLMSLGLAFWFAYQTLLWTYFEVFLRQEVPDVFWGDVILFLHIVPMMAALVLQPQAEQDERTTRLGSLDFSLLLVWWLYLYVFAVIPWQYAVTNVAIYQHNLNSLYLAEKIVFLCALAAVWLRSSGVWKIIHAHLLGANLMYALSSYLVIWAIERHAYYSGSLYDIPLVVSMAWMAGVGVMALDRAPNHQGRKQAENHGVWIARMAMAAIFSLPLFAAWSLLESGAPPPVRSFRLMLTLASMMVMGAMVFVKQHMLDGELMDLLRASRHSYENLTRLQEQLVQSEKLASLGQLVGGAAHEINNPLTAMLGYSDLLAETSLSGEQRDLAERIGYQVRHTKFLVSSLLSFAKQVPGEKTPLDVNALAEMAIKLSQAHLHGRSIQLISHLRPDLPQVRGDSNQLLQVLLHIINSAVHAMENTAGALTIETQQQHGMVVLEFFHDAPGVEEQEIAFDQVSDNQTTGLGLSACYRIIQQHNGKILYSNHAKRAVFRIELPADPSPPRHRESQEALRDEQQAGATLTLPPTP